MVSPPLSSADVRPLRILVVEDEALIACYLRDLLIDLGHECVGPFGSLDDALRQAETAAMDAGILDLVIDGKSAYAVAEILARREIPFGFASGVPHTGFDAKWEGRPYLDKPYSLDGVRQFVLTLLEMSAAPEPSPSQTARQRRQMGGSPRNTDDYHRGRSTAVAFFSVLNQSDSHDRMAIVPEWKHRQD